MINKKTKNIVAALVAVSTSASVFAGTSTTKTPIKKETDSFEGLFSGKVGLDVASGLVFRGQ